MNNRIGGLLKLCSAGLLLFTASCASLPGSQAQKSDTVKQKIGRPYQIGGLWYYPKPESQYDQVGIASWYGGKFHGAPTANGEIFDMNEISGAHTTLPLPSWVEVTNLENSKSLVVRINDRGPFVDGRLIDLSKATAEQLGFLNKGVARVRVRLIDPPAGVEPATARPEPPAQPELIEVASLEPISIPPEKPAAVPEIAPAPEVGADTQNVTSIPQPVRKPEAANPQTASVSESVQQPLNKPTGPAPAEEQTAAIPGARYLVQIATFSSPDNAERLASGFDASLTAHLSPYALEDGRTLNRVRLGPFGSRAEAEAALGAAQAKGLSDARIFRQNGS